MGKILEPDIGRPSVTIDSTGGEVVIQFDRQCQWIGFTPDNAIEFAYAVYEKARRLGARGPGDTKILLPFKR